MCGFRKSVLVLINNMHADFLEIFVCFFSLLQEGAPVYSPADGQPNFDVPVVNITAITGTTAILPCTINSVGEHKVAWMDPRKKLLTVSDARIIQDQRISVERPYTNDWNLHLRHVRMNDSGEYQCQINTSPVKSKKIVLFVQEPPSIIEHSEDHVVREGDNVALWCKVDGEPYPSVTWYRKYIYEHEVAKEVIGLNGEALQIHNISRFCEDMYECVANNGIEPVAIQQMRVTVHFAPEVELYTTRLSQAQGKETILDCKITANPHGLIVWKRKGKPLQNSAKYGINVYEDGRHTKTLSLRIGNLNEEDFGKYKCYAENAFGKDELEMTLYEHVELLSTKRSTSSSEAWIIDTPPFTTKFNSLYYDPDHNGYPTQTWYTPTHYAGSAGAARGGCVSTFNVCSYDFIITFIFTILLITATTR